MLWGQAMTGHFRTSYLAIGSCFLVFPVSGADEPTGKPRESADVLTSDDAQREAVRKLISVASNQEEVFIKRQIALESLGSYRSQEAIDALLDNLLFNEVIVSTTHSLGKRPAAKALAMMGDTPYPRIWERLRAECSDDYVYVLAHLIYKIDGKEAALAQLKARIDSSDTERRQCENLKRLEHLVRTIKFTDPRTWP
jgi:hypothetical protein